MSQSEHRGVEQGTRVTSSVNKQTPTRHEMNPPRTRCHNTRMNELQLRFNTDLLLATSTLGSALQEIGGAGTARDIVAVARKARHVRETEALRHTGAESLRRDETNLAAIKADLAAFTGVGVCDHSNTARLRVHIQAAALADAETVRVRLVHHGHVIQVASRVTAAASENHTASHGCRLFLFPKNSLRTLAKTGSSEL
jgi:hypothetical protein